jgi:FkbM family methyltransferase
MDRVRTFRLLEQAAQPLRRAGLGPAVDRVRGRFERGLGRFTTEIDGLRLTGMVALHTAYADELRDAGREATMSRLFAEAATPGALVVDVGAHLGWLSMQAARRVGPAGRVIAFEPNPRTRPLLEHNLRDNGLADRVRIEPRALGARPGRLSFYLSPAGDTSSLHRQAAEDEPVEVEVVTGDAVLAGGPAPSVIKLDVEGGELDALAGLEATIHRAGPELRLFVECNPSALAEAGASPEALWAALERLGLEPQVIDEAAGALRGREALHSVSGYANLVCAPARA